MPRRPRDRDEAEADDEDTREPASEPARAPQALAVTAVDAAVMLVAAVAGTGWAFQRGNAGSPLVALGLVAPFGAAAALGVHRLRARGELREALSPKSGNLTFAAGAGLLMYVAAMALSNVLAPQTSARGAWLATFYLHVAPAGLDLGEVLAGRASGPHHGAATAALVALGLFELALRALVFRPLVARLGAARATLASAAVVALGFAPTAVHFAAGPGDFNPMLVLFALESTLIASLVALRSGRVLPSVFAVALFAGALFEYPLWTAVMPVPR